MEITSKSTNRKMAFKGLVDWYKSIITCINKVEWLLLHAVTQINPIYIILSKISQTQR